MMLVAPPLQLDRERRERFEALAERILSTGGAEIDYHLPHPLHEFTRFLVGHHPVLLHGTADSTIDEFRPRRQTDFDNRYVHAVFATSDGIWPLFFAVIDRTSVGATRNICLQQDDTSYYYFSLDVDPRRVWRSGTLYVLPQASFRPHRDGIEWTSGETVRPLARLTVEPDDFPFRGRVVRFDRREPLLRTLLRVRPGRLE